MIAILAHAGGGLALLSGQPGVAALPALRCGDGRAPNWISVEEVKRTFTQRAVDIVRAAMAADRATLTRLVSSSATFVLWRGDAGTGQEVGVEGALAFAQHMNAVHFESFVFFGGPISTDPCGVQEAKLWFLGASGERSFEVRFRFNGGLLVAVEGQEGQVIRGDLVERRGDD